MSIESRTLLCVGSSMAQPAVDIPRMTNLRKWNLGVGLAHLAQAVAILLLSNNFAIPVVAGIQTGPPGTPITVGKTFFDLEFAIGIALFLLLAAADHLLMASPGVVSWYERNLRRHINYARWLEYSISASLMIVLIAMLPGITNLYALIGLFAVNAAMILFGLLMERMNQDREEVTWWPFLSDASWVPYRGSASRSRSWCRRRRAMACPGSSTASSYRCLCCSTASP